METVLFLGGVAATSGVIAWRQKKYLNYLNRCKKVDSKDFTGYGYIEDTLTSSKPIIRLFEDAIHSLITEKLVYLQPIIKELRDSNGYLFFTQDTIELHGKNRLLKIYGAVI